jgi:hypothetical protein
MYVNAKTIPFETIPGMLGRKIKESSGVVNSRMIYHHPAQQKIYTYKK